MKQVTKILTILSMALVCAFPHLSMAADIKMGIVDMRTLVSNSPQTKNVMEKLKKEFKTREDKILALDKSLKEKSEKMQRNSAIMSEAERSKLEKDIVANQRDLQRLQTEFREDAGIRQQEEMKKVVDRINTVVNDIAKKEKYDLIIHSEAAPFASKEMDITNKVMTAISPAAA